MAKPTHILIPIKDIEEAKNKDSKFETMLNFRKVIENAKQISLNEDDINKAASAWEETNNLCYPLENEDYKRTYQQVIKDIFKL